MSHYSASNYAAPNTASNYTPYHRLPAATIPINPPQHHSSSSTVPTSSSYGTHRSGTSSHHTSYRYHPYSSSSGAPTSGHHSSSSSYNSHSSSTPYYSHSSHGHSSHSRYSHSSSNLERDRNHSHSHYRSSTSSRSDRFSSRSASNLHSSSSSKKVKAPRNEFGIPYGQPGAGLTKPDWSKITLQPFQKNFYREAGSIAEMKDSDVIEWRKKYDIVVMGHNIPRPIRTFQEAGFPPYILTEINRAGFVNPTPIQSQGWPMAMSGRDVIGVAETGSGKTLAFLLPCIVHINAQPLLRDGDGPIVLVIAPTRELAIQIENEVHKFAYSSKIKHCCVYGGVSRREQIKHLRNGVEIIICTPGRLLDFLECGTTNLRRVTYLVIDEADRLLDMGFEPQLSSILSQVRPDRQILMWSATWPKEVQLLSKKYFLSNDVIQVSVGSALQDIKANHNVKQIIDVIENSWQKQDRLYSILRNTKYYDPKTNDRKLLIFACTKKQCNSLYRILKDDGFSVCVIHGDKQQYERDQALNSFKSGACSIMIATDVASRGIHVNNIYIVINYDFPQNIEDYVHRIGRTGRCGNKGIAISFFTKQDGKRGNKLISILKEAKQEIPPKLVQYSQMNHSSSSSSGYGGRRYSSYSR